MSTVNAGLGSSAAAVTLEYNGKQYTIRPIEMGGVIADLERWFVNRELETQADATDHLVKRGLISADAGAGRLFALASHLTDTGKYAFGSVPMNLAMFGQPTVPPQEEIESKRQAMLRGEDPPPADPRAVLPRMKMFSLMIGVELNELMGIMHAKGSELRAKLALVMGESLPAPKEEAPPVPTAVR